MPQGGGARLGPIHSQTIEALLHHIPGLVVAAPATPADAKGLLAAAIASDDPVVILEHTALYDTRGAVGEDDNVAALGHASVRRSGSEVSIVASSRMAIVAEAAAARLADEHGIDAEVIDLRSVRPLDHATIAASVRRTGRAVLVEEGWPDGGIGATLAARIATATPGRPVARVTGADVPMPYARTLEQVAVPDETAIVATVRKLVGPSAPADGATDHTISTEIDMESLLDARRRHRPRAGRRRRGHRDLSTTPRSSCPMAPSPCGRHPPAPPHRHPHLRPHRDPPHRSRRRRDHPPPRS